MISRRYHRRYPWIHEKRSCLLWNIDTNLRALGKPEEMQDACREPIESCQTGGGLRIRPGCALPPNTPAENVHALVESATEYSGRRGIGDPADASHGGGRETPVTSSTSAQKFSGGVSRPT